jgi:hypothetical protein
MQPKAIGSVKGIVPIKLETGLDKIGSRIVTSWIVGPLVATMAEVLREEEEDTPTQGLRESRKKEQLSSIDFYCYNM